MPLPPTFWSMPETTIQKPQVVKQQSIPTDLVPENSPMFIAPIDTQNLPSNMPKVDTRQYQISEYLKNIQKPELKSLWGTQPNYTQKIQDTKEQLLPKIDKLSNKQLDTAMYIANEAQKRNINPGFAIAQAMHETFQKKDIKTIFENTGGNLTGQKWSGPKDEKNGYTFLRTFETIPVDSWISEFKNRPWIIFEKGTTKQSKLIQNPNSNITLQLNNALNEARKTDNWQILKDKLNNLQTDEKGNLHLSIKDRFKKFENEQQGINASLDLLKKKLK